MVSFLNTYMNTIATNTTNKETYIKCKKCSTEVLAITKDNLTPCKCGAISVDGSKDLLRVVGNPEDYEKIQK
jgi:Zn finger protein HypA/HybF involved in hydrogenase expression